MHHENEVHPRMSTRCLAGTLDGRDGLERAAVHLNAQTVRAESWAKAPDDRTCGTARFPSKLMTDIRGSGACAHRGLHA